MLADTIASDTDVGLPLFSVTVTVAVADLTVPHDDVTSQ